VAELVILSRERIDHDVPKLARQSRNFLTFQTEGTISVARIAEASVARLVARPPTLATGVCTASSGLALEWACTLRSITRSARLRSSRYCEVRNGSNPRFGNLPQESVESVVDNFRLNKTSAEAVREWQDAPVVRAKPTLRAGSTSRGESL
jgi:hypothetical protein